MADCGRSRSRSPHRSTYLSTVELPLATAQEPAGHNQVMWLVKEEYGGRPWYRQVVHFHLQLEEQYQTEIPKKNGELTYDPKDGSDVVIHYYTHDLTRKPWTQTRFYDENREYQMSSKEIVRVLHCM